MAEHTPGPWEARPSNTRIDTSVWSVDGLRCIAQTMRTEDARLVAAAPDLLTVLKSIRKPIKHDVDRGRGLFSDDDLSAVEAAIAKAEGR